MKSSAASLILLSKFTLSAGMLLWSREQTFSKLLFPATRNFLSLPKADLREKKKQQCPFLTSQACFGGCTQSFTSCPAGWGWVAPGPWIPSQHPRTAEPARTEQPLLCAAPLLVSARSCSRRSLRCKSCGRSLAQEWRCQIFIWGNFLWVHQPQKALWVPVLCPTLCKSAALLKPRPFLLPFAARDCFPQCSGQIFIGVNGNPGLAASLAAAAD